MKNILYYHVYLTDEPSTWSSVFLEQMKCMEDAGMFSVLDEIRMTCITQLDARNEYLHQLCNTYPVKFNIEFVQNSYSDDKDMLSGLSTERTITENYTYRKIYNDCQKEEMIVCYIHTKGITSSMKFSKDYMSIHKNYYYWRQYLNWGVLEKWKTCISALQEHDVAGVNFYMNPSPHFSGNFWWANSSYITKLPDPATVDWWRELQKNTNNMWLKYAPDRFRDEQWLCSLNDVKIYNVFNLLEVENPAASFLPKRRYVNEVY